MENIAHTFFATALGQIGLKKLSRLGMATLIISANLPDIDLLWSYYSDTAYIIHHRGITHTFLGIIIQILILSFTMYFFGKKQEEIYEFEEKVSFKNLILLSSVGLLSHLGLDYLNDYGIQPFFPFSDIKIQGSAIFIVDIWFWALLGGFTFISIDLTKKLKYLFSFFGLISSYIVLVVPDIPTLSKILYILIIISLFLAKISKYKIKQINDKLGLMVFGIFFIYLASVFSIKNQTEEFFKNTKLTVLNNQDNYYQLSPKPANPFEWIFFAKNDQKVFLGTTNFINQNNKLVTSYDKNFNDNEIKKALETETGKAFLNFSPYIFAYKKKENNCVRIFLRDARYIRAGENSFASRNMLFCNNK
ncbi:MAG: metal-dependent hydrolase [Candidatus Sericytochromatia bacterium]